MKIEYAEQFNHKIKSPIELEQILSKIRPQSKIVMCHGVFDVVHPGHIRHLMFAKSKASVLIVSITADQHISKGEFRPHVPQDLRAINLAALEFVDFVLIDSNSTPIENIKLLRPDLFAKGYEYSPNQKIFPRTAEETAAVREYGGEILFTPGDFVLSSSNFIRNTPPSLKIEKLLLLMKRADINFDDLRQTLKSYSNTTINVIGDTIVDSLSLCRMVGGQSKTPTVSVAFEKKIDFIGGAAIVAAHLKAAGANVRLFTLFGDDSHGEFVKTSLRDLGIEDCSILDLERPTTNKNAIVVGNYRLLKIDTVDNRTISDDQLEFLCSAISSSKADAYVFSDFRHGIFNKRTIPLLRQSVPQAAFKVADSQVASRWGNILEFQGFDLITPNEREARFATGDQDSGIRTIASEVFELSSCKMLVLKLSDRGILTQTGTDASTLDSYFVMDSFAGNIKDAVGAGDALLAYTTLTMLVSKNPVISSILGNLAAACECEIEGNVPITPENILKKIDAIEQEAKYELSSP